MSTVYVRESVISRQKSFIALLICCFYKPIKPEQITEGSLEIKEAPCGVEDVADIIKINSVTQVCT